MEQGYCTEWQCWVRARACQAGAGHGGCGCSGWVVRQSLGHRARAPQHSEVRLQLIPPQPCILGWRSLMVLLPLLRGVGGWAYPGKQGSRTPFVLADTSHPRPGHTPGVGAVPRSSKTRGVRNFHVNFSDSDKDELFLFSPCFLRNHQEFPACRSPASSSFCFPSAPNDVASEIPHLGPTNFVHPALSWAAVNQGPAVGSFD